MILFALFMSVWPTSRLCCRLWFDPKFRYWTVCVAFRYTMYTVTHVSTLSTRFTSVSRRAVCHHVLPLLWIWCWCLCCSGVDGIPLWTIILIEWMSSMYLTDWWPDEGQLWLKALEELPISSLSYSKTSCILAWLRPKTTYMHGDWRNKYVCLPSAEIWSFPADSQGGNRWWCPINR